MIHTRNGTNTDDSDKTELNEAAYTRKSHNRARPSTPFGRASNRILLPVTLIAIIVSLESPKKEGKRQGDR